jgi:probable F420-dependent oxidoreductase
MKIGFKLPNCAGVLCEPAWATPENLLDLSRLAHKLGYDSLWMHDHLVAPDEVQLEEPNFHDPLVSISHLAAMVPDITFGMATLILPLRDPVALARQLVTMQAFFPKRLIAGVGIGRYKSEFLAAGSPLFHQRGKVTTEALKLIRALWEQPEADFEGEFFTLQGARFYPKPEARGGIPIWVGGNAKAAVRRAAALGDGYVPAAKLPGEIREDRALLLEELERHGRHPQEFPIGLSLTVDLLREAEDQAAEMEARGLHGHAEERVVRGGPHRVTERFRELADAGVSHFLLSFRASSLEELKDRLAWFARDMMPHLKSTPVQN